MLILIAMNIFCWVGGALAQHSSPSPYSLQAAVDALNRREVQLALKERYNNGLPTMHHGAGSSGGGGGNVQVQDYWAEESEIPGNIQNRHRLNRILAKYLAHENSENNADHGALNGGYNFDNENNNNNNYLTPEEKKRSSFFRERDGKYDSSIPTVFRERESQPYDHAELTEQFLREIEESRELDREERYKEALRLLWEKYQQQDNEIDGDRFEEQKRRGQSFSSAPNNYYIAPLMQKKRTYPVLPWLPVSSRKKRFPVAKRSPKMSPSDDTTRYAETNEKVAQDLSELFGKPSSDEKRKRSTDEQLATHSPSDLSMTTDMRLEKAEKKVLNDTSNVTEPGSDHAHHDHTQHRHQHRKRNDHSHDIKDEESHGEEEDSEEHDDHDEHEEEEDDEEHEDFDDEEEEERKKKRDVMAGTSSASNSKRSNLEIVKEDQIIPGDLSNFRRKKSIQWSKYFGIDRRKKSAFINEAKAKSEEKKLSTNGNDADAADEKHKEVDDDRDKLDNMDRTLQSIENKIIDETIKYTGAHEGIVDPDEIRQLKDHVVSRLASAYSLEKMRRALEKLRQSVENENHLLRNVIDGGESQFDDSIEKVKNQKRLSVKKEKVQFDNKHHSIGNISPGNEKSKQIQTNLMLEASGGDTSDSDVFEENQEVKKEKKKRNSYIRYPEMSNNFSDLEDELGAGYYEPLNDAYLGNKNYILGSNQCPIIESMAERCHSVDLLSGDVHQDLLPVCGIHQICYLCGVSQVACDFQYLAEADTICGHDNDCQSAARSVLMILRGSPGPQLGPKECLKNPCLYSAMREIGL